MRPYNGHGAVRLYELDPEHRAALYERCDPGDEFDEPLFHRGAELLAELAAPGPDDRLLHGDFNQRNVLLSARGWLAIDPRPVVGDPAFELALWLVNRLDADPHPIDRARRLAARLDLSQRRTVQWLAVQSIQLCSWLRQSGEPGPLAGYERKARLLVAASG